VARRKKIDAGVLTLTIDNPIGEELKKLPKKVQDAVKKVVRDTGKRVEKRIRLDTPRDRGTAAAGWKSTEQRVPGGVEVTLTNKVPYINVLEFGGYPVKPKWHKRTNATGPGIPRGDAILGGYPPGPRTQKGEDAFVPDVLEGVTPGMNDNVSRQAPSGMVRQNLIRIQPRFQFDLEEAVAEAYADIAARRKR
jgi:hypothetical protein